MSFTIAIWVKSQVSFCWQFSEYKDTDNIASEASEQLTNVSPGDFNLLITVDIWEKSEAESVTARWIGESVNAEWRLWGMEWFTYANVLLIVWDGAPKWRLSIDNWLSICYCTRICYQDTYIYTYIYIYIYIYKQCWIQGLMAGGQGLVDWSSRTRTKLSSKTTTLRYSEEWLTCWHISVRNIWHQ